MSRDPYQSIWDAVDAGSDNEPLTGNASYDAMVRRSAAKHGVDPLMVASMMKQESGGHRGAVSPKGASGLMQLMPDTARGLGVRNIFDPEENIDAGVRYFKQQRDRFGSDELALAAYNAGPERVEKAGNRIPNIAETQKYVKSIMANYGRRGGVSLKNAGTGNERDPYASIWAEVDSDQGGPPDIQKPPEPMAPPTIGEGMRRAGNVDLTNRPRVKNADGSISTVRSMSFGTPQGEVLVPTVTDDGRILSDEQAQAEFRRTGRNLGIFDTPEHATAYAKWLHENQAASLEGGVAAPGAPVDPLAAPVAAPKPRVQQGAARPRVTPQHLRVADQLEQVGRATGNQVLIDQAAQLRAAGVPARKQKGGTLVDLIGQGIDRLTPAMSLIGVAARGEQAKREEAARQRGYAFNRARPVEPISPARQMFGDEGIGEMAAQLPSSPRERELRMIAADRARSGRPAEVVPGSFEDQFNRRGAAALFDYPIGMAAGALQPVVTGGPSRATTASLNPLVNMAERYAQDPDNQLRDTLNPIGTVGTFLVGTADAITEARKRLTASAGLSPGAADEAIKTAANAASGLGFAMTYRRERPIETYKGLAPEIALQVASMVGETPQVLGAMGLLRNPAAGMAAVEALSGQPLAPGETAENFVPETTGERGQRLESAAAMGALMPVISKYIPKGPFATLQQKIADRAPALAGLELGERLHGAGAMAAASYPAAAIAGHPMPTLPQAIGSGVLGSMVGPSMGGEVTRLQEARLGAIDTAAREALGGGRVAAAPARPIGPGMPGSPILTPRFPQVAPAPEPVPVVPRTPIPEPVRPPQGVPTQKTAGGQTSHVVRGADGRTGVVNVSPNGRVEFVEVTNPQRVRRYGNQPALEIASDQFDALFPSRPEGYPPGEIEAARAQFVREDIAQTERSNVQPIRNAGVGAEPDANAAVPATAAAVPGRGDVGADVHANAVPDTGVPAGEPNAADAAVRPNVAVRPAGIAHDAAEPVAPEPVPDAVQPAETVQPVRDTTATGLADIGEKMAAGISESLTDAYIDAFKRGQVEPGNVQNPSVAGQVAKRAWDAGVRDRGKIGEILRVGQRYADGTLDLDGLNREVNRIAGGEDATRTLSEQRGAVTKHSGADTVGARPEAGGGDRVLGATESEGPVPQAEAPAEVPQEVIEKRVGAEGLPRPERKEWDTWTDDRKYAHVEQVHQERDIAATEARTDFKTGAGNDRSYQEAYDRIKAETGTEPIVSIVDANGLKALNDAIAGHAGGDDFLKAIVGALKPEGLVVHRIGGDEFAVIGRDEASQSAAVDRALETLRGMEITGRDKQGNEVVISNTSFAHGTGPGKEVADARLYEHKQAQIGTDRAVNREEAPPSLNVRTRGVDTERGGRSSVSKGANAEPASEPEPQPEAIVSTAPLVSEMMGTLRQSVAGIRDRISNVRYGDAESNKFTFDLDGVKHEGDLGDYVLTGGDAEADKAIALKQLLNKKAAPIGEPEPRAAEPVAPTPPKPRRRSKAQEAKFEQRAEQLSHNHEDALAKSRARAEAAGNAETVAVVDRALAIKREREGGQPPVVTKLGSGKPRGKKAAPVAEEPPAATEAAVGEAPRPASAMTADERTAEIARLKREHATALATPLVSEGSIGGNQLARMGVRQRAAYERRAMERMQIEARIRELSRPEDAIQASASAHDLAAARNTLSANENHMADLARVGTGKNGKPKPRFQAAIDKLRAENDAILAKYPELQPKARAKPASQGAPRRELGEIPGDQRNTPEFKRWFGESKFVDEEGKPKVAYHGTVKDFDAFEVRKAQDKMGRKMGLGWGKGKFYFADNPYGASGAASGAEVQGRGTAQNVMPVYLRMEKPITAAEYMKRVGAAQETGLSRDAAIARVDREVKREGYDGIIDENSGGNAVFEPTQIKSAIGNRGTFDPNDPSIVAGPKRGGFPLDKGGATPGTQRIQIAPIRGGKAESVTKLIANLAKGLDRRIAVGVRTEKGHDAEYFPGSGLIKIRSVKDPDGAAHEAAHALDDGYGIVKDWVHDPTSPYDAELIPHFSRHGSEAPEGHPNPKVYERAEGVAEWMRAYMLNPDAARAAAPKFAAFVESKVPPKVMKVIDTFGRGVRELAGVSAIERAMSGIETEAPRKGMLERLGLDEKGRQGLRTRWTDRLAPVVDLVKEAKDIRGLGELLPDTDPELLARLFSGANVKAARIIEHGIPKAGGTGADRFTTPGGLKWILEPFTEGKADGATIRSRMNDARALLVSRRQLYKGAQLKEQVNARAEQQADRIISEAEDRAARYEKAGDTGTATDIRERADARAERVRLRYATAAENRANRLTGIGQGLEADQIAAQKILAELEADPERMRIAEAGGKRLQEWADASLQYLRDKGRISAEEYDTIKKYNEEYVALQRVMDETQGLTRRRGQGAIGVKREPIQRFKGSQRDIVDPFASMLENAVNSVREADRNEVLSTMRDLLTSGREMYEGEVQNLAKLGFRGKQGDPNTITIYKDGEAEHWTFEPEVYRALKGLDDQSSLPAWARAPGALLRLGVTKNPAFMIRNVMRDALQSAIISDSGSATPLDPFLGFKHSDRVAAEMAGMGQFGHNPRSRADFYKMLKQGVEHAKSDKNSIVVMSKDLARHANNASDWSEVVGRMAEYKRAYRAGIKEGLTPYQAELRAAGKARGLLDFATAGTIARQINQIVPFTNAAIQGLRSTARGAKRNPGKFSAKALAYAVLPEIAAYAFNANQGPDVEKEYWALPPYLRDAFWNFKVGPDLWVRVPKPFEIGAIASFTSRAIQAQRSGDTKGAFEGYGSSLARSLSPVDAESAILGPGRGAIEVGANYDFYRDRPIIPTEENEMDVDKRDTSTASRVGQLLQKGLGNTVDARKIDHFISSQLGGLGTLALRASDIGREDKTKGGRELGMYASGVLVGAQGTAQTDVAAVFDRARGRNEMRAKAVKDLIDLRKELYKQTTPEGRQSASDALENRARELRKQFDTTGTFFSDEEQAKTADREAKKQADKEAGATEINAGVTALKERIETSLEASDEFNNLDPLARAQIRDRARRMMDKYAFHAIPGEDPKREAARRQKAELQQSYLTPDLIERMAEAAIRAQARAQ